jgi:hypothetical protein
MTSVLQAAYNELALTNSRLRAEIERLTAAEGHDLKTKAALRTEIERLRTQCGGNCRYWEGRWRDEKAENDRLEEALARALSPVREAP